MRTHGKVLVPLLVTAVLTLGVLTAYLGYNTLFRSGLRGPTWGETSAKRIAKLATVRVTTVSHMVGIEKRPFENLPDWITAGSVKVSYFAVGDADLVVDLKSMNMDEDATTRKLTLTLPWPVVERPRLDAKKSKFYDIGGSLLGDNDKLEELRSIVQQKAQDNIAAIAASEEYVAMAKEQAEAIVQELCRRDGWTVAITWAPRN